MRKPIGFTLVEVLVVISVIGILATITVVSYSYLQRDARDAKVKDGADKISEAIEMWNSRTNATPGSVFAGSGSVGAMNANGENSNCSSSPANGTGWIGSGKYPCTLEDILVAGAYLPSGYILSLPGNKQFSSTSNSSTYMIQRCQTDRTDYVLLYSLENPSAKDKKDFDAIDTRCTASGLNTWRTSSNMQGAKYINFHE